MFHIICKNRLLYSHVSIVEENVELTLKQPNGNAYTVTKAACYNS